MAQLPYLYDAELQEQSGQRVIGFSCSVWPATQQREGRAGEIFDHTGEGPYELRDELVAGKNRLIVLKTGPMAGRYRIVGATPQPFTRHVGLELTRVAAVG